MNKSLLTILILLILINGCIPAEEITYEQDKEYPKQPTKEPSVTREIEECPHECCINTDYKRKDCSPGYDCINNKCIAKDTDGDGLSDIEERSYGTSSTNADTDNDGLTDYVEVKVKGTNPTKQNTDDDRYNDNEDPNPLVKNSADVKINIVNSVEEPNLINIGLLSVAIVGVYYTGGVLAPVLGKFADSILYTYSLDLEIKNNGNDYTNYVNFNLVYKLSGTDVKRESVSLGKLNAGESVNKHFVHEIKTLEVPESLFTMLSSKGSIESLLKMETQWMSLIEEVEYERF